MSRAEFTKRAFIALAVALLPVLVWYVFDVILIVMGALLISELLNLGAEPFSRWLKIPSIAALSLSGVVILAILGGAAYLFGTRMAGELQDVIQRAASGQNSIVNAVQQSQLGKLISTHIQEGGALVNALPHVFSVSAGFLAGIVVMVIAGIFFAAQPDLYRTGLVRLFPPRLEAEARTAIEDISNALRLWLLGQLLQMVVIGLLTTIAAWLIGLPSPLALGLIAGIAEFIPYLGPIISAVPAVLVAATQSLDVVMWTLVAYVAIHQAEGHLIMPFIQRYMIFIPPAVILLGIAAIGSLFGALAVTLASPIAAVVYVLVKRLYIRDTLGEDTRIPGEDLGRRTAPGT